jgi:DNA-binding MarR family transcriptional regulator
MPVNRPQSASSPAASADGRLYLRDQDLDQGAALIRAAARRLDQLADTAGGPLGLSGPELDILLEIHDRGPIDVTELRSRLDAPKQSMARNLNTLEASGMLARQTSQQDRRRRLVTLTPEGMTFARGATERRREALRLAFLSAGPDAVTGARRVLSELSQRGER